MQVYRAVEPFDAHCIDECVSGQVFIGYGNYMRWIQPADEQTDGLQSIRNLSQTLRERKPLFDEAALGHFSNKHGESGISPLENVFIERSRELD
jgi:hypothetical protein